LQGTARHCKVLQGTARHCKVLQGTARHGTARHCKALHGTARHCKALQGIARHGKALHGTARHCRALQGTTGHCRALQGTAGYPQSMIRRPLPVSYTVDDSLQFTQGLGGGAGGARGRSRGVGVEERADPFELEIKIFILSFFQPVCSQFLISIYALSLNLPQNGLPCCLLGISMSCLQKSGSATAVRAKIKV